jgi:hypothetical protein
VTNTVLNGVSDPIEQAKAQGLSSAPVIGSNTTRPMNGPADVSKPTNRLGGMTSARSGLNGNSSWDNIIREESTPGTPTGSDLLLTDVLSFEIKADWDGGTVAPSAVNVATFPTGTSSYEFPFNVLPPVTRNPALAGRGIFDTWFDSGDNSWVQVIGNNSTQNLIPQPIRVRALQIKVRVWDRKNNMARQVTIVSAL